jgi:hypothetical protein
MSDPDDLEAILLDLQHNCADLATVLGLVATCPERLARVRPALLQTLRAVRPKFDRVITRLARPPDDSWGHRVR